MVRYRLPAGSVPPLTDVIGHLEAIGPTLRVRTKRGDVVDVAAADVVAIKALAAAPVRTGDIRNLEHAAALAALALILFGITLLLNSVARLLVRAVARGPARFSA